MKNQLLVAFLFEVALALCQWAVTDRSAAAVHTRRIAGPHPLTETAGVNAKIWISVLLSLVLLWSVWHFAGPKGFSSFFFFNSISCFSENANCCCLKCNRWLHGESCSSAPRDIVCLWGESHLLASSPAAVLHFVLRALLSLANSLSWFW